MPPTARKFAWRCDLIEPVLGEQASLQGRMQRWGSVLDGLLASGDVRQRAAALRALATIGDGQEDALQHLMQFRAELIELAQRSNDNAVYVWALRMCQSLSEPCALSNQGWAERDPDNAAPWLARLAELNDQDVGGVEQALSRLAAASRHDDGSRALLKTLLSGIPAEVQGWPRMQLAEMALIHTLSENGGGPDLPALLRQCTGELLADANRRQRCEGIYQTLLQLQDTGMMAVLVTQLEKALGHPSPRHTSLTLTVAPRLNKLMNVPPPRTPEAARAACADGAQAWQYMEDWAESGELTAMRALVKGSRPH